jgi:glycosyltransferase involved in cell wall biosynthesis
MPVFRKKIIIAAEPIENGAGLANFLLDSVSLFSQARPEWQFTIMAMSHFSDAADLERYPNVKVVFCDRLGWRGALSKTFSRLPGKATVFNFLADKLPVKKLRWQFGNLAEIWDKLEKYDAVWVPHFAVSESRWPALYVPETVKAPVLLSIFDLHPAVFPGEWKAYPGMVANFWGKFKPFAQNAEAVITHSRFQKEAIVKHFEVDPDKISVAYMPITGDDAVKIDHTEQEAIEELGRKRVAIPYVFSPMSQGTIHKNHIRLIRAWSLVRDKLGPVCPRLVFTSKGTPEQYKRFCDETIKLGLKDRVIFTGLLDRKQMGIFYQNCTAVVSPTIYESGCGLPILEALSLGKQIAGSDIPPVREQMEQFGTAIHYFDPLDEKYMARVIVEMLEGPDEQQTANSHLLRDIGKKSRQQFAESYLKQLASIV